jgi:hypothetical protein
MPVIPFRAFSEVVGFTHFQFTSNREIQGPRAIFKMIILPVQRNSPQRF